MGLVSIGEFSRLSRLSPKALRLYDELGLLVPDHVDPVTGYRVYDKVPHRHQREPWHWWPVYGAPEPCYVCGLPVR